jgi:hypothetical protein
MISDHALQDTALTEARRLFESVLSGELRMRPGARAGAWDPMLRRHVYSQVIVAWRKFGQASVLVSDRGHVLAFRDENRMLATDYEALEPADALTICRATGLVVATARIVRQERTPANLLLVLVEQRHYELPKRLQLLINTKLRLVAALQVLEETV